MDHYRIASLPRRQRALLGACLTLTVIGLPACAQTDGVAPGYYFSDCQSGAAKGCVTGDNANSGTRPDAPKQTLAGFNINNLPAGSKLYFARGGVWNHSLVRMDNRRVSAEKPLVFDAYGAGPAPVFRVAKSYAFEFGGWQNTELDGGYVFRNLKLDGQGTAEWGFWLRGALRDVVIENMEITGFGIAINSQGGDPIGHITVRNSRIVRNRDMGVLGHFNDSVFEGNTFAENNFRGSTFSHALYLSGGNRNRIKGNNFINNSVVDGECRGGNVTMHGQMDTMLIEDNLVSQVRGSDGCFGFSITTGYNTAEWFRKFTVRNNTVVNVGGCAICADAVQDFVVEGNRVFQDHDRWHYAVLIRNTEQPNDAPVTNVVVRNNVACFKVSREDQKVTAISPPGVQVVGNQLLTGAAAAGGACTRPTATR